MTVYYMYIHLGYKVKVMSRSWKLVFHYWNKEGIKAVTLQMNTQWNPLSSWTVKPGTERDNTIINSSRGLPHTVNGGCHLYIRGK